MTFFLIYLAALAFAVAFIRGATRKPSPRWEIRLVGERHELDTTQMWDGADATGPDPRP